MIRASKKLLKQLIQFTGKSDHSFSVSQSGRFEMPSEPSKTFDADPVQLSALLTELSREGYLKQDQFGMLSLTLKALHRREYRFYELRDLFLNRFLYGFITGVLTTIATAVILHYWGLG